MGQCQWVTCLITFIGITTCLARFRGIPFKCASNTTCAPFKSCHTLNGNEKRVKLCGWTTQDMLICCPVLKLETIVNNIECATFDNRRMKRVIGGHNAKRGSWPWMAAIFNQAIMSGKRPICGGTLISASSVLTAANCVHDSKSEKDKFFVVLGELKLGDDSDGLTPIEVEVSRILIHENYTYPQVYNDIAIVKLKKAVTFTPNIRPICLPGLALRNGKINLNGKNAAIAGWGRTAFGGSYPTDLQEASVQIVANAQCDRVYKSIAGITNDLICAGGYKDSCVGDSGGPLAYNHEDTKVWILVGIISSGYECGRGIPGIHTRVSEYMDWIGLHI